MAKSEARPIAVPETGAVRRNLWEAAVVAGFLVLCGFDILHHTMWRDEMQPWLFARDSATIPELFRNMHYEAHPRLWYLILFGVTRFTSNPEVMPVLNLLIMGAAIAVFVRFCPLPLSLKALTVFGSFFVFEWGTVSRNYALGVLFCFLFCAWFPRRKKGYLGLAAVLFLATQSNMNAVMIAASLAILLILEAGKDPDARARIAGRKLDATLSILLVLGGGLLAAWTVAPKPDIDPALNYFKQGMPSADRIVQALVAVCDGFFPQSWIDTLYNVTLYRLTGAPRYSAILAFFGNFGLRANVGAILLLATVAFFRRSRLILWTYLGGAGLLLVFAYIKVINEMRHSGHFFLWFLICVWLAHYFSDSSSTGETRPFTLSRVQRRLLCAFLIVQVLNAAAVSIVSCYLPYSCSKAVALYIQQHHLDALPIFGYPDYSAMPVSGYLNRRIYYPDTHRWGSFVIENNQRQTDWKGREIMKAVEQFAAQGHPDFLVLLSEPMLWTRGDQLYEVTQVGNVHEEASFYPAVQFGESYWLFRYHLPAPPR